MARRKRQSGFTLLEALMASGLLAMAAAGILLPLTAAAASQTDAQRRVVATRFAADVIERRIAGQDLNGTVSATDLNYSESTYKHITAVITSEVVFEDELILLTVEAFDGDRPITTLKTLAAAAGPAD